MTKKLTAMPYAHAHVYIDADGNIQLISYTTLVAKITHDGILIVFGLYSATTRKHIGAFVKEYAGLTYQTAKAIYESGAAMNIYTGEVIDLDRIR